MQTIKIKTSFKVHLGYFIAGCIIASLIFCGIGRKQLHDIRDAAKQYAERYQAAQARLSDSQRAVTTLQGRLTASIRDGEQLASENRKLKQQLAGATSHNQHALGAVGNAQDRADRIEQELLRIQNSSGKAN